MAILKKEPKFEVVGEYRGFAPVRPLIPNLDAEVVLVDISMGKESGLEVAKYIKNVNPSLKVIILSSHKEEFYIVNRNPGILMKVVPIDFALLLEDCWCS